VDPLARHETLADRNLIRHCHSTLGHRDDMHHADFVAIHPLVNNLSAIRWVLVSCQCGPAGCEKS
jgi:hypothetical protein